jgi:hypothetical protein
MVATGQSRIVSLIARIEVLEPHGGLGGERAAAGNRLGLATDALDHVGTWEDEPDGPGQGRRGRLVPRHEEGEHVVEQLFLTERPAVLVARLEQH